MALYLIRLRPDRSTFARWAHRQRLLPAGVDEGYAWHAVLKAVLGDLAPQPFVVRNQSSELLAYSQEDTRLWTSMAQDSEATKALGLEALEAKPLPEDFRAGDRLSFEVRVRPIVRSRQGRNDVKELDAAVLRVDGEAVKEREVVYREWLSRELNRESAADLSGKPPRLVSYCRTQVLRRAHRDGKRQVTKVEGPDVLFRGELVIKDPESFLTLLARGLGRHRAFGFGCLLIAPPGALR